MFCPKNLLHHLYDMRFVFLIFILTHMKAYSFIEICHNKHYSSFSLDGQKVRFPATYQKFTFITLSVIEMCRKL